MAKATKGYACSVGRELLCLLMLYEIDVGERGPRRVSAGNGPEGRQWGKNK